LFVRYKHQTPDSPVQTFSATQASR